MKSIKSVISLPVLFVLLFCSPVFGGDNWVKCGNDGYGNIWSYNKDTIKWKTKNIVQVWERLDYSDEGKDEMITVLMMNNEDQGYKRLSYGLSLEEYDCMEGKSKTLSIIQYDSDGKVLVSSSSNEPDLDYIVPDTMGYVVMKMVCNKPK